MFTVTDQKLGQNTRKSFSKTRTTLEIPNLIEVQTKSFDWFLNEGFDEVLRDVSPIKDHSGTYEIEFLSHSIDRSLIKYPVEECKERDVNYAAPLKVKVRLRNNSTGEVKETDIVMGDFPLMTENGTFVINGAERVIVSQIIRSPGMYYSSDIDKSGKRIFAGQIIPYRGAWIEYEIDCNDIVWVKIDKNRKLPITMFIRALGMLDSDGEKAELDSIKDITALLGDDPRFAVTLERDESVGAAENRGTTASVESLREIYRRLRPGEPPQVEAAITLLKNLFFDPKRYDIAPVGRYKFDKKMGIAARIAGRTLAKDVVDPDTGEVLFNAGAYINEEDAREIEMRAVNEVEIDIDGERSFKVISNCTCWPEALLGEDLRDCGIREKVRTDVLKSIIEEAEGDIDSVREAVRARKAELCPKHITREDIYGTINYLLGLAYEIGTVDDIDHLGNRRIRSVGEQLQNQIRIGFSRMDKVIRERMTTQDAEKLTPQVLINVRPVATVIREFFGSSQLSQFMDQANPLSELTHKRRLSALGPGGLSRDRASFDVRDVHYTHYGRMCPIETPEGPNIGLISYLATYARISDYGFIEAPYRRVKHTVSADGVVDTVVTDEIEYMTADVEDNYVIAQANEPIDDAGHFINAKVTAHERGEFKEFLPSEINYMDVSPKMVVSAATAMIPFLENDDNSRALMGSNMQKQAVPLMVTESPIVGTGMEYKVAVDSGVTVNCLKPGVVTRVESHMIVVDCDDGTTETYPLLKFKRTNQGTCHNQRPIVVLGDRVEAGQVIADGPATSNGELALGKNALIGFMTWEGYNYEDAVLLNENLVRNDVYTSLHIEVYTHEARSTKLGDEEITRELPQVGDDALKNLDDEGIVIVGTEVHAGDILVGKVTPKGETDLTPEERLLRAIFGEKTKETRNTSLVLPHGESGVVVAVRVFTRENYPQIPTGVNKIVHVYVAQKRKISVGDKMAGRHGNKGVVSRILPPEDMPFLPDGTPLDIVLNPLGVPSRMNIGQVLEVHLGIAARKLGWNIMTPVFDGANERDILECMKKADMWREVFPGENVDGKETREIVDEKTGRRILQVIDGKTKLYDGRTGEAFDNPVTVGIMYYLKLHHLVDDKIHARSNGPYSLVTQQPLGGKAQFGGQRFGEMEVWALEAYGAAYTLQEILTVKSDDVNGRRSAYQAIIEGQSIPTPGVPESFKVLVKELQSLGLNIQVLDAEGKEISLATVYSDDTFRYTRRPYRNLSADEKIDEPEDETSEDDLRDGFTTYDENGDPVDSGEEDDDLFGDEDDEEIIDENEDDDPEDVND
ncbi:MAG: DNA-directed RNA polymerase subunit beta [Clostridia bacterium]|nr:DNA-directed RNA polymerase subunit beta [Clostridia bacterium]